MRATGATHPFGTWVGLLTCALLLTACPKGQVSVDPEASDEAASESGDEPTELAEVLGERSQCRSGRIQIPNSDGFLRAVVDDERAYSLMLPALGDWTMACGDDPYFVGQAMSGAVSATVYPLDPEGTASVEEILSLLGQQLETELETQGMVVDNRRTETTELGVKVLRFKVTSHIRAVDTIQFNYITARKREDGTFINLHLTVTAQDDGSVDPETEEFADGLVQYANMFRVN